MKIFTVIKISYYVFRLLMSLNKEQVKEVTRTIERAADNQVIAATYGETPSWVQVVISIVRIMVNLEPSKAYVVARDLERILTDIRSNDYQSLLQSVKVFLGDVSDMIPSSS